MILAGNVKCVIDQQDRGICLILEIDDPISWEKIGHRI